MNTAFETMLLALQERKNMTLGIDHLKEALNTRGNLQDNLRCIHIGGTNGKGSTTDFIRSILQTAGFKVGSFTSPHLKTHNDRIRINNEPISDEKLHHYMTKSEPLWETYKLSMFEIDMLMSIEYFTDEKVDWVVYEVGLGGRLDATNVIKPVVSAITNVDFDHMGILGSTLKEIAFEKAGIIKTGSLFITTERKEEPLNVFKDVCAERKVTMNVVSPPHYTLNNNAYNFNVEGINLTLSNQAVYQVDNASLAIAVIKCLDIGIDDKTIKVGIESTHWAGRFEEIIPGVYLDGAHNLMGVKRLVESLQILPKPWTIVFTALSDKEHHEMVQLLVNAADTMIITEFDFYRAQTAEKLAADFPVKIILDYKEAIDTALKNNGTIIVTGSLYFISEARQYLIEKNS